jgi:hypothetical protein
MPKSSFRFQTDETNPESLVLYEIRLNRRILGGSLGTQLQHRGYGRAVGSRRRTR